MTLIVLAVLALAWAIVLAPDVVRLFRPRRKKPVSSMDQFHRQLESLRKTASAEPVVAAPQTPDRLPTGTSTVTRIRREPNLWA